MIKKRRVESVDGKCTDPVLILREERVLSASSLEKEGMWLTFITGE